MNVDNVGSFRRDLETSLNYQRKKSLREKYRYKLVTPYDNRFPKTGFVVTMTIDEN